MANETTTEAKKVTAGDVQRLYLQAIFSRRFLSAKLAKILWSKCVEAVSAANEDLHIPHSNDNASWDVFVDLINTSLNCLDLEFRHLHDEISGREMYALVNRRGDEIAQMATAYSALEIAFFRAIVDQIMLAPHESFCVGSTAALREASFLKTNMSKTQAELVLGSFVAKGWLLKSRTGRYTLSTRSLLELIPFLRATYPDEIIECTICMEVITHGMACYTPNCKTRMHYHCFANYIRRSRNCTSCNAQWPDDPRSKPLLPVGEEAARNQDGRRRVRTAMEGGDQEVQDDEDDEDHGGSQQTQVQKGKKTKKARVSFAEEDINMDENPQQTQSTNRRSSRR